MACTFHSIWNCIRNVWRLLKWSCAVREPEIAVESRKGATLISMSIDIAGSTEAKSRILAIAAEEGWRHQLYESFYRQFLAAEDRFYEAILRPQPALHGIMLDWRRLFVVKGIGDEIWLLYEVTPDSEAHITAAAVRLVQGSLVLLDTTIHWAATEREHGPEFDPDAEMDERHDTMNLAYKVHIDVISDAHEISRMRADYFRHRVPAYLGKEAHGDDSASLASCLNAGFVEVREQKLHQVYRTDYIGHEVDRFFRTAKAAVPCAITMGEALFDRLRPDVQLIAYPGLFRASIQYDRNPLQPGHGFRGWHDLLFVRSELPAAELKGIGYSYRIYTLATRPQLNGIWFRGHDQRDLLLAPTLERFPVELREKLQTVQQRSQSKTSDNK